MKTIGILGGLGPQATMDFEQRLHKEAQKQIPQKWNGGYPPMISYYFRQAPMKLNPDGSFPNVLKPNPNLLTAAKVLGQQVDFLIIPSNTPYVFQKDIEKAAKKPVISIVDVTLADVKKRKVKKVGLLAIGITLKNRLYQERIEKYGFSWVTIPDELAVTLDESIKAVMEGKDPQTVRQPADKAIAYLRKKGTDGIILGCTEIPLLLGTDADAKYLINPAQLLAEAAIAFAIK